MQAEVSGTALIPVAPAIGSPGQGNMEKPDVMATIERHAAWPLLSNLAMCLSTGVPIRGFKVRDLLKLQKGSIVESEWQSSSDVPLCVENVEAGWCEFEVVEQKVSVRITRLA